ncbi:MAG: type II toxin-antitoxin system ParD family antitoxin [Ilumatobacteraceae bacterium]
MKLSVSLPDLDCEFLDSCVESGTYASRSAVVARALRLLRTADLGKMYDEAFAEWHASEESADWESLDQTVWEK